MLVERQGSRHRAGRARLTRASSASSMHSQACHYSSRFSAPQAQLLWRPSQLLRRPSLRRLSGCFKRPPPENSSLNRTRRCQRRFTLRVSLPLLLRVARLGLRASVFSFLDASFRQDSADARPFSRVTCATSSACALTQPRAYPLSRRPTPSPWPLGSNLPVTLRCSS
jgi:hypothetical protein